MPSVFGAFGKSKPTPKPTTDGWSSADLVAHSISLRPVKPQQFFGHDPLTNSNPLPPTSPLTPEAYTTPLPLPLTACETLPEATYDLLTYLTWASRAVTGEENALVDFVGELLKGVGFTNQQNELRTHKQLEFKANTRIGFADADAAVETSNGMITLVVKVSASAQNESEIEAQAIEAAIAAFHQNNHIRQAKLGLDALEGMEMPAMTMLGTKLTFYLVPVTKALATAPVQLTNGKPPKGQAKTVVTKCQPISLKGAGMEDVAVRKTFLAYLTAYQGLAEGSCRNLTSGLPAIV